MFLCNHRYTFEYYDTLRPGEKHHSGGRFPSVTPSPGDYRGQVRRAACRDVCHGTTGRQLPQKNCQKLYKNLLIEGVDVWQRFYRVPSLQDLFKTVKPEVILEFLKVAALYMLLLVV